MKLDLIISLTYVLMDNFCPCLDFDPNLGKIIYWCTLMPKKCAIIFYISSLLLCFFFSPILQLLLFKFAKSIAFSVSCKIQLLLISLLHFLYLFCTLVNGFFPVLLNIHIVFVFTTIATVKDKKITFCFCLKEEERAIIAIIGRAITFERAMKKRSKAN